MCCRSALRGCPAGGEKLPNPLGNAKRLELRTHTFDAYCIPSVYLEFEFTLLKAGHSRTLSWSSLLEQLSPPGILPEARASRSLTPAPEPLHLGLLTLSDSSWFPLPRDVTADSLSPADPPRPAQDTASQGLARGLHPSVKPAGIKAISRMAAFFSPRNALSRI